MIFLKHPCPSCSDKFSEYHLIKKCYDKSLKWYQITPAPNLYCPHCHTQIKRVVSEQAIKRVTVVFFITVVLTFLSGGNFLPKIAGFAIQMMYALWLVFYLNKHTTWQIVNDGL